MNKETKGKIEINEKIKINMDNMEGG